jgi:glycosyltransferase involved in cell wall biosynthesis
MFRSSKLKKIVAVRGMLAKTALNVKPLKKKLFLSFAKMLGLYRGVAFHVTNTNEHHQVKEAINQHATTYVVDNLPDFGGELVYLPLEKKAGELKMVSLARISVEKNIHYALEALKEAKEVAIQFDLYGSIYDAAYWDKCTRIIETLPKNVTVNFKDSLPSSLIRETISQYHVLFMPTQGENFGHAILESLMASVPVLISDKTPWSRVQQKSVGKVCSLDEKPLFEKAVNEFALMNQEEYNLYRKGAFEFASNYIKNNQVVEEYVRMFSC